MLRVCLYHSHSRYILCKILKYYLFRCTMCVQYRRCRRRRRTTSTLCTLIPTLPLNQTQNKIFYIIIHNKYRHFNLFKYIPFHMEERKYANGVIKIAFKVTYIQIRSMYVEIVDSRYLLQNVKYVYVQCGFFEIFSFVVVVIYVQHVLQYASSYTRPLCIHIHVFMQLYNASI